MGLFDLKSTGKVLAEVAECDKQILNLETRKKEVIYQIGKQYVEETKPEAAVGTIYEEPLKKLMQLAEEVDALERRKLALQGQRKCHKCGYIIELESAFCNKCGEKQEALEEAMPKVEEQNKCPNCGAGFKPGAMFCMSCGSKLGE